MEQKAEKYGESEGDQNRRIRTKEGLMHKIFLSTFGLVISWKLDGKSPTSALRLDRSSLSSQPKLPVTLHPTPTPKYPQHWRKQFSLPGGGSTQASPSHSTPVRDKMRCQHKSAQLSEGMAA